MCAVSKSRFWGKEWTGDKLAAYNTLYTVLTTLCGLCAPFIPFMSESMYQNLVVGNIDGAPESVHLSDFPTCHAEWINADLEAQMEEVMQAVQLGRACRSTANIKVRQALSTLYIKGSALSDACAELIKSELNVEDVQFISDARAFTAYQIKPQMRTLGPKYGKLLGKIGAYLKEADGSAIVDAFDRGETWRFEIDGTEVELTRDDALISPAQKPGFVAETEGDMTVVIDTNLTPVLIEKGYVRELISKLQTMRKEAGFDVVDRIQVSYQTTDVLAPVIEAHKDEIAAAVLATEISCAPAPEGAYAKEWNINGEKAALGVKR